MEERGIEEREIDDERAFGWNDSVLGPRDSAFKPSHEPLHGAFGRDYPRDLGYHVQMRDLHHARGGASGHYTDRGGKSGGDEERGRDRDRYNERDRNNKNKDFQRSRDSDRDRDRDPDHDSDRDRQYTITQQPSKPFNIELNKQIMRMRICDTRELFDFV